MNLRYLSLFSGIEAATVAWKPLGWEAAAFAQYEPNDKIQFPSKVLQYHYPNVPNLGDVTKITEEQIKALGHIDLVVGGSPCQDLSIAGQRRGLVNEDGSLTRSGLFDYQMQIFEWAVKNNGARFMLWENVPGAFSSNQGNDFAYILGTMVQGNVPVPRDGWKNSGICVSENGDRIVEWRVLDAQYFGVPQRRRRIFALLHTGAWGEYPPVLFESESLPRDSEKGERKGKGSSKSFGGDFGEDGFCAEWGGYKTIGALCAVDRKGIGNQYVDQGKVVMEPKTIDVISWKERDRLAPIMNNMTGTLAASDYKGPSFVGYMEKDNEALCVQMANTSSNGSNINHDVSATLAKNNTLAVAYKDEYES